MTRYGVWLEGSASTLVEVETDETDLTKIAKLAQQNPDVSLCNECAEHVELEDTWEPVRKFTTGEPAVTKFSN